MAHSTLLQHNFPQQPTQFSAATKEIGYTKASIYGPPGTGKTTLMAMLLIYLSKTYHQSAPVAWLASEKGVDFLIDMFEAEGVPLLLSRSRSFIDLRAATRDAITSGACAVGVDSITHFWQELFTEGMKAKGPRLHKIGRIKEEWAPFSKDFRDSPLHFLVTGRLGYNWDEVETENEQTGEITKELSRGGTKIKAESDFGHEPDLEIEMSAIDDPDFMRYEKVRGRSRKTFKSQKIHIATLQKSRVWALNGKAFSWKDQPGYKLGYYQTVAESFAPHFEQIGIGGSHNVMPTDRAPSSILFTANSEHSEYEHQIKRTIALEKWDATMGIIAGGQTKDAIKLRTSIGVSITGTRSKTEFERQSLAVIERQVAILMALELRFKEQSPTTERDIANCIGMAIKDVENPEHKEVTFIEVFLGKQAARLGQIAGPQPVVAVLDKADELMSPF
jgi:hypothetical protein